MSKPSKRFKKCLEKLKSEKPYSLEEAVALLKDLPHAKFDETVELACRLNVDPKQSEQTIRGTIVLPHGIGKEVKVCIFCKGEDVSSAKNAGAEFAGGSELIEKIKQGWFEFDQTASTPEMMKDVAQLGRVLGPRGLMPSPKTGTVGPDIEHIVKELKSGKVQFKADKTANIHAVVGKLSFSAQELCENAAALIKAIRSNRPAQIKGRFIKNIGISTTMGPSLKLDLSQLKA